MSDGASPVTSREIRVLPNLAGVEGLELRDWSFVVVDVLRASTTIAYALEAGARGLIPVPTVEEATRLFAGLDHETTLLAGERHSVRIDGFALGNSPVEMKPDIVAGKTILLTTTNGARAMAALTKARGCATAALVNVSACARRFANEPRVAVVCAGSVGRFSIEDFLCAGLFVEEWIASGGEAALDDGARTAREMARGRSGDVLETLRESDHGRVLESLGFDRDLALAADVDRFTSVSLLRDGRLVREAPSEAVPPR